MTSLVKVTTITKAQMEADPFGALAVAAGGAPQCDVALYAVVYQTIGVKGEQANSSGALFVPQSGCKGPFPLIAYAHGTILVKAQSIEDPSSVSYTGSAPDASPVFIAAIYASHGYAIAATDYLGLAKSTYPYHPYLDDESEASAVIDSLRAARLSATKIGLQLTGGVFVTGHSQGGQSAVATQRAIERDEPGEFKLLGTAASSGPYALTQTFLDSLKYGSQDAPILATYILTAYQKIYGNVYTSGPADVFQPPYSTYVDSLLPVATYADQALLEGKTLPLSNSALLQPAWVTSFENDPTNGARVDAATNDLLQNWVPVAPLFICGGSQDPEVEYKNVLAAQAYFTSVGAKPAILDVNKYLAGVPKQDYHVTVAAFCFAAARANFFDVLAKSAAAHRHL